MKKMKKSMVRLTAMVLGILAVLGVLMPALSYQGGTYMGYEVAFNYEVANIEIEGFGSLASAAIPYNMVAIGGYLAALFGIIVMVLSKKLAIVSVILFVAGGVLFLLVPTYAAFEFTIGGNTISQVVEWELQYGLILSIVFAFLAALSSMLYAAK